MVGQGVLRECLREDTVETVLVIGRHSSGIERGTQWLTRDDCSGTFTRVQKGQVVVTDYGKGRDVLVKADDLPTTLALLRGDDIPLDGPSLGASAPDDETDVWVDTDEPDGSEDAWELTGRRD